MLYAIWYRYICQLGAVAECAVANICNLLAVNFSGDFISRTVSCVFGYCQRTIIKLIGN